MTPSPLGLHYRFTPHIGLEAAYAEHPTDFSVLRVPGIQEAIAVQGELEAMIAARDRAVTEAMGPEMVGVVDLGRVP